MRLTCKVQMYYGLPLHRASRFAPGNRATLQATNIVPALAMDEYRGEIGDLINYPCAVVQDEGGASRECLEPDLVLRAMTYYHWALDPVKLCKISYPQSGHPKPNGFWFDVNESWKRWCEATQFCLENLRYCHTVTVLDTSHILFLRNAKDIDRFTHTYGRNLSGHIELLQNTDNIDAFTRQYGRDLFGDIQRRFSNYIMWEEVAEKHSGIIIDPYSRARSLTYLWYYGWNCAGGCVWDTSVIRLGKPCKKIK